MERNLACIIYQIMHLICVVFVLSSQSGKLSSKLTDVEQLALLIGCFCHDLDHRGTNNAFQIKWEESHFCDCQTNCVILFFFPLRKGNALAMLYSTSTMEHHHFDHCIMILNSAVNTND